MIPITPNTLLQKAFIESNVEKLPPHKAISISSSASCAKAIDLMIEEKIGCLLVSKGQEPLCGIFTERDVLLKLSNDKRSPSDILIHEIMTPNPQVLQYHASIAKAIYLMAVGGFRHIPIKQKDGSYSVISVTDFIRFIFNKVTQKTQKREEALEVIKIDNTVDRFFDGELGVLTPSKPLLVGTEMPIGDVVNSMIKGKVGSAVIGNVEKRLVGGLVTERDLIKKYILHRVRLSRMPIEEIMTPNPVTLQPTASVLYALDVMTQGKFRHIPIVDFDERLTGVLSIKNFLTVISGDIVSELTKAKS